MRVTDEMVEAFANVYHFRGQTYAPDLVRAALEAALSHAAGQDGEQCRAASVDSGRLASKLEDVRDGIADVLPIVYLETIDDAIEALRALSRGVPEGNQAAVDSVIRQYCRTCGGCGGLGDEVKFALYQLEQMAQGGPLAFDAAIIRAAANLLRALAKKAKGA